MTLSVVARCPDTGRFGVAVASCCLAAGTRIGAARAGVGAVVVQAGGWLHWRPAVLDLLDRGLGAAEAVAMIGLLEDAPASQLAAVGASGPAAAATGPGCTAHAGHAVALLGVPGAVGGGERGAASAQAGTMAVPEVAEALLAAFTAADGPLQHRLVEALVAADAMGEHGPDYRGRQSAAVLVVPAEHGRMPTGDADDPHVDLRVDDAEQPTQQLARLVQVHAAHRHLIRAGMTADPSQALEEVRRAAATTPGERVVAPLLAIRTALAGDVDGVRELLRDAAAVNPATWQWAARSAARARAAGEPHAAALEDLLAAEEVSHPRS